MVSGFSIKDAIEQVGGILAQLNTYSKGEIKPYECSFDSQAAERHSVFINCPNGRRYEIPVCPHTTVMHLKEAIEDREGANYIKQFQQMNFHEKLLADNKMSLADYGITGSGEMLDMVFALGITTN